MGQSSSIISEWLLLLGNRQHLQGMLWATLERGLERTLWGLVWSSTNIIQKRNYHVIHTIPPKLTISVNTSLSPEYFPGGAVWNRDLTVSWAMLTSQQLIPALPPANRMDHRLSWLRLWPTGVRVCIIHSYVPKKIANAGTSNHGKKLGTSIKNTQYAPHLSAK